MSGDKATEILVNWFLKRFWPAHSQMDEQAQTIAALIAGQVSEPAGFVDSLFDPQPLMDELTQLPATPNLRLRAELVAYLVSWQAIRAVARGEKHGLDGVVLFDYMLKANEFFGDLIAKSMGDRTSYLQ